MLLLDLDGVVVFEAVPPQVERLEILRLHDLLAELLRGLGMPVVVLTHRSRAEAFRILHSAGLTEREIRGVVAAEDIFRAALMSGRPWMLASRGMRKSWALPLVERRYGVARARMAFIDDRLDNLRDMLSHGIGLAVHAPSDIAADGSLITSFDFQDVVVLLNAWKGDRSVTEIAMLEPRVVAVAHRHRTGLDTRRQSLNAFNRVRRIGGAVRRALAAR
jgi:hypothetical protein